VGAAPVQNIGAYGVELQERFHSLTAWDVRAGRLVEMSAADCRFSYRDSVFKHDEPGRWVIVSVRFALPRPWRPVLGYPDLQRHARLAAGQPSARDIFDAVCEIRRAKLPDPAVTGKAVFSRTLSCRRKCGTGCWTVFPVWCPTSSPTAATSWRPAG
jgi:UDP-N-acetylmuramate dehydrogenase